MLSPACFPTLAWRSNPLLQLERCTVLDPRNPIYRLVLARTFEQMDLAKKGALEYRAVLALDADNAAAMHGLAANLASHGDSEEAEDLLLRAVVKEPRLAPAHYLLATIRRYQDHDDPHLQQLRSLLENPAPWSASDYSRLSFALGRALDQLGDFAQAFRWIQAANEARKKHRNSISPKSAVWLQTGSPVTQPGCENKCNSPRIRHPGRY